jgi:hypothetical protein
MPKIPPNIAPMLAALNIVEPATSRWRRLDAWPLRRIRSHCYCECGGASKRMDLASVRLNDRNVFIGQCGGCKTIYWRDAVKE